jgi:tetratricopeptide (TPR) repeat protein
MYGQSIRFCSIVCCLLLTASQAFAFEKEELSVYQRAEKILAEQRQDAAVQAWRSHLDNPDLSTQARVTTLVELAALLTTMGQHDRDARTRLQEEAANLIQRGLQLADTQRFWRERVDLLYLQWVLMLQKNQHQDMAGTLLLALDLLEANFASEAETISLFRDLSYTYMLTGHFDKARQYIRRAIVHDLESGQVLPLSQDYLAMGDSYLKTGSIDTAIRYFKEVAEMNPEPGSRYDNLSLSKLATAERMLGRPDQALQQHLLLLDRYQQTGRYRELVAQIEIAKDYLALGELQLAHRHALAAYRDNRAFLEQKLDAALVLLDAATQEKDGDQTLAWITEINRELDSIYQKSGSRLTYPLRQVEFRRLAIKYFHEIGNDSEVVRHGEAGLAIHESIRKNMITTGDDVIAWTARVEPFTSRYVSALSRTEPGRIIGVLDQVFGGDRIYQPVDGRGENGWSMVQENAFDQYLAAEKALLDANSEWQADQSAINRDLLDQAVKTRDRRKEIYLAARPPPTITRHHREKAKSEVPAGLLFLRYYVSDQVSLVIARGRDFEQVFELPSRKTVLELGKRFTETLFIQGDTFDTTRLALNDLGVLWPFDPDKFPAFTQVVVVPDDATYQVPFSALNVSEQKDGYQPLNERVQISRAYSVSGYLERVNVTSQGSNERKDIVIFADPEFAETETRDEADQTFRNWNSSLSRLPYTASEAASIEELFPTLTVNSYLGVNATGDVLMQNQSRNARILHIATHGYYDPATPDIVGIATSVIDPDGHPQSGFLGLTELMSQPFHSNLVIISGCETMLGRSYAGTGVRSLTQTLLDQGAGSVIGTLWKVPDRATADFMKAFYVALKQNDGDAVEAVRMARMSFIHSTRFSHPRYWAGFALASSSFAIEKNVLSN